MSKGVDGRLEGVVDGVVQGWAWAPGDPSDRLEVVVVVDGRRVATGVADRRRGSLVPAGIGDGSHAFSVPLPVSLGDRSAHTVQVLAGSGGVSLPTARVFDSEARAGSAFAQTSFAPARAGAPAPVADRVEPSARADRPAVAAGRSPAPYWVLAAGCAAYFLFAVYLTRHFGFFQDELDYILHRRSWNAGALLDPVNQHLFLLPMLIYKLLFATVGLGTRWPYQYPVFALHIACVAGIYVLAARRAGPWIALPAAWLLLVLGAGFELELWGIGMSTIGALAACVWCLVFLERGDRRGDVGACVLLAIALATYSIGLFVAVAIAVQLAIGRNWRRLLFVVGVPLALYALWYLGYGQSDVVWANVHRVPLYVARIGAWGFAGIVGLSEIRFTGWPPVVGGILFAAAAGLLIRRLVRHRSLPPLTVVGTVAAVGFWVGTALARANYDEPDASRYVYPSAVLILVAAVGLLRERRVPLRWAAAGACACAVLTALGAWTLSAYSTERNRTDTAARAQLGAAEVAGSAADPTALPDPNWSFVTVRPYLAAVHAIGSPAFTPSQISSLAAGDQQIADRALVRIERIKAIQSSVLPPPSASCARLTGPPGALLARSIDPGETAYIIERPGTAVELWLRRLSATFATVPTEALAPGIEAQLRTPRDASRSVWWLEIGIRRGPRGTARVCVGASA